MNHPSLLACPLLLLPYTLTTVNDRQYVTDSQGVIAFYELGLMNQEFFSTSLRMGMNSLRTDLGTEEQK